MEKIIFADIDGVFNNEKSMKAELHADGDQQFDIECVERLNKIVEVTGAKIVVSSSWRKRDLSWIRGVFVSRGFKYPEAIIGETERGYHHTIKGSQLPIVRGNEIKMWVDTNLVYPWHAKPELSEEYKLRNEDGSFKMMRSNEPGKDFTYVILDDDCDMLLEQAAYFIRTDWKLGLTEENMEEAIQILNGVVNEIIEEKNSTFPFLKN